MTHFYTTDLGQKAFRQELCFVLKRRRVRRGSCSSCHLGLARRLVLAQWVFAGSYDTGHKGLMPSVSISTNS